MRKRISGLMAGLCAAVLAFATPQGAEAKPRKAPAWAAAATLNRATYSTQGWAETKGGQGGRILRVTTLNASGPGSFRAAVEAEGPRIIVFEVGGVIDLRGQTIQIRNPFLTIAGQTAPNPGITFIEGEFSVSTHDVIIQHIMVRPGDSGHGLKSGWDTDGLSTRSAYNVIIDHCSFSWATDENLSTSGPRFTGETVDEWRNGTSHNITLSNNLVYEGLRNSSHSKGEHSKGGLIHDNNSGILLLGNVYASNVERNALFKGGAMGAMVNNFIYNPGQKAVHYNLVAHEWAGHDFVTGKVTLIGNVYRQGPDTRPDTPLFALGGAGDVELYLADNLAVDGYDRPVAQTGRYTASSARLLKGTTPYLPANTPVMAAARLEDVIYATVGARPWARDPIDFKVLSDAAEGRGEIIDSQSENYVGYPDYPSSQRPFVEADWNLEDMSPKAGWDALFSGETSH